MCWEKKDTRADDTEPETWGAVLYEYTQTTGIHGLKQITEPTPFCFRRLIWAILLTGGIILFAIQVIDSVIYYRSYPVTVNLKINYNQTLNFPAITICNQNSFRVTVAADKNQYSNISSLYLHQDVHHEDGHSDHDHFGDKFLNQSMRDLFLEAGHTKNDLIVSCKWDGSVCGPDDFQTSVTDHGVCYTFNGDGIYNVSQTGADRGLRLRLNIEQYEYMQGPNDGAGLKILIHDQNDVPMVKDLGQAIPPGSHAFVYINIVQVENLGEPHGVCNSKELEYYERYTMSACLMDCRTKFIVSKCQCRDYYMPRSRISDYPPVCSVDRYIKCLRPALELFNSLRDHCDCPVPCSSVMFNPTITYAANSNFDMEKMLQADTSHLLQQYQKAREVRQKVDTLVLQNDQLMAGKLQLTVYQLSQSFEQIVHNTQSTFDELQVMVQRLNDRIYFHYERALAGVYFIVKHDFIRGWEVIEERTLPYVTGSFIETYSQILRFFDMDDSYDSSSKQMTFLIINNAIDNRLELCNRVRDNLTDINKAFATGDPLLTYKHTLDRRYDEDFMSLEVLQSVPDYEDREKYFQETISAIDKIEDSLLEIKSFAAGFLSNSSVDKVALKKTAKDFLAGCRYYNYRLFQCKDRIVLEALNVVKARQQEFQHLNNTFQSKHKELTALLFGIRASITLFNHSNWMALANATNMYGKYVSGDRITKAELADIFNSDIIEEQLITTQQYFTTLHSRTTDLKDKLKEFGKAYADVYANMFNEPSTKTFYSHLNSELKELEGNSSMRPILDRHYTFLAMRNVSDEPISDLYRLLNADLVEANLTGVFEFVDNVVSSMQADTDLSGMIGQVDEQFLKNIKAITVALAKFVESSQINYQFYGGNFMHLDVFFRELSYEQVTQQEAYDMTSLWSDIGGSIGLFVGASALTIFEVVDVFFFTALKMQTKPKSKKRHRNGNSLHKNGKENNVNNSTALSSL